MRDKLLASGGVNAAVVAVTLLFAACSEHQLAATAPASPQGNRDPMPATSEAKVPDATASTVERAPDASETGAASWYGAQYHGKRTASGAVFDMYGMTAAYPTLPLGTVVIVENLADGRAVAVRITDRRPYAKGRIIDLSLAAALRIGVKGGGTAPVRINVIANAGMSPATVAAAAP
jgi:rare lipoprotein A